MFKLDIRWDEFVNTDQRRGDERIEKMSLREAFDEQHENNLLLMRTVREGKKMGVDFNSCFRAYEAERDRRLAALRGGEAFAIPGDSLDRQRRSLGKAISDFVKARAIECCHSESRFPAIYCPHKRALHIVSLFMGCQLHLCDECDRGLQSEYSW